MPPRVCAVTVAWNIKDLVCDLIAALNALPERLHIIAIDNASTDGTADEVARRFPDVELVQHSENRGGAGGFNAGIRRALMHNPDYVWLIDGDACVTPGALQPLIDVIESDPRIAAVGSQIAWATHPKLVQEVGANIDPASGDLRLRHYFERVDPDYPVTDVTYVPACSMLVRREALEQCGAFREDLFVSYDDVDWCIRATKLGWRIVVAPQSVVVHHGNPAKPGSPVRDYYGVRNRTEFLFQNPAPSGFFDRRLWRWLHQVELMARVLAEDGDSDHSMAVRQALEDAIAGRFGPASLPRIALGDTEAWQEVSVASLPTGPILLHAAGHLGNALEMLSFVAKHFEGREIHAIADPPTIAMFAAPSGWRTIVHNPDQGGEAIRIAKTVPADVTLMRSSYSLLPRVGRTVLRYRGGRLWRPTNPRALDIRPVYWRVRWLSAGLAALRSAVRLRSRQRVTAEEMGRRWMVLPDASIR